MRYGRAIGRFVLGSLRTDVNPLTVSRQIGKSIDQRLRDLQPIAHADVLSHEAAQFVTSLDHAWRHSSSRGKCLLNHARTGKFSRRARLLVNCGAKENAWASRPVTPGSCWRF